MTTLKSLKEMYVKLGGNLTDKYSDIAGGIPVGQFSTIPEMIQACTKKAGTGGGGGGKDEIFWVNATFDEGSPLDKTFAEISAAVEDGMLPIVKLMDIIELPMVVKANEQLGFDSFLFAATAQAAANEPINLVAFELKSDESFEPVNESFLTPSDLSDYATKTEVAPFVVTFTASSLDPLTISTADKTYAEVAAAWEAGKRIIGKIVADIGGTDVTVLELSFTGATTGILGESTAYMWQVAVSGVVYSIYYLATAINVNKEIDLQRFIVNYTSIGQSSWTADKTVEEIYAAWEAGKNVLAIANGSTIYKPLGISSTGAAFNTVYAIGGDLKFEQVEQDAQGNVVFTVYDITKTSPTP